MLSFNRLSCIFHPSFSSTNSKQQSCPFSTTTTTTTITTTTTETSTTTAHTQNEYPAENSTESITPTSSSIITGAVQQQQQQQQHKHHQKQSQFVIGYEHDSSSFLLCTTGNNSNLIELVQLKYRDVSDNSTTHLESTDQQQQQQKNKNIRTSKRPPKLTEEKSSETDFINIQTKTFKRSQSRILCQMDPSLYCASASINSFNARIVALTTLRQMGGVTNPSSNATGLYETFLIQLSDYSNHHDQRQPILFRRSRHFQRVQFVSETSFLLFCVNDAAADTNARTFRIELYKFQLNRKTGQMLSSPTLHMLICDSCVWFQWDPDMSYLYYMASNRKREDATSQNPSLYISCWKVTENMKIEPVYKYNVPIRETDCMYTHDRQQDTNSSARNSKNTRSKCPIFAQDAHQRMLMKACCPGMDYCVVSLDNNVDCLCKQEYYDGGVDRKYIMVQVFVLTHQQTIKFAIPLNPNHFNKRAFFGRQKNVLVVYVPELFLKLITINKGEQPANLVTLTSSQDIQQSISNLKDVCKHIPEGDSHLIPVFSKQRQDSFALNVTNGEIYNYRINCDALLELMRINYTKNNKIERTLPMLHWSIVHEAKLKKRLDGSMAYDFSFAEKIIYRLYEYNHTCSRHRLENTYLFKEFILATSYMIASNVYKMDPEFLMLIPNSIISSHPLSRKDGPMTNVLAEVSRSSLWNQDDNCLPSILPHTPISELTLQNPYETGTEDTSPTTVVPSQTLAKTLWSIFSSKSSDSSPTIHALTRTTSEIEFDHIVKEKQQHIEADPIALCWRYVFNLALKNSITSAKVGKSWLAKKWATGFTFIITNQVSKLFQIIQTLCSSAIQSLDPHNEKSKTVSRQERQWYFELLELLYRTLEEIGAPPPPQFHYEFSLIAFHVLPQRSFLQYVKRRVFFITKPFVDFIYNNGYCKDAAFYSTLLQYMVRSPIVSSKNTFVSPDNEIRSEIGYLESDIREKDVLVTHYHLVAFQEKMQAAMALSNDKETRARLSRSLEAQVRDRIYDDIEDTEISWDSHQFISAHTSETSSVSDGNQDASDSSFSPLVSFLTNFNGYRIESYSSSGPYSPNSVDSSPCSPNGRLNYNFSPPASSASLKSSSSSCGHNSLPKHEARMTFVQEHSTTLLRKHTPWI